MKTKSELLTELNDTLLMLNDAVELRNWTIAGNAAGHCEALCAVILKRQRHESMRLYDVHDSLNKLGALLAKN